MEDPRLERKLNHVRELMKAWQGFHKFFLFSFDENSKITKKHEAEFLRIKIMITLRHDALMASMEKTRESAATASSIMSIVENCILLRQIQHWTPAEKKRLEIEWHDAYLLINETLGILEEEHDKLSQITKGQLRSQKIKEKSQEMVKGVFSSNGLKYAVTTTAAVVGLIVLPMMGVYDFRFLQKHPATEKIYILANSFARQTVWPSLEYDKWEYFAAFNKNLISMDGYKDLDANSNPITAIMRRKMEDFGMPQFGYHKIGLYSKSNKRVFQALLMTRSTAEARDFEEELEKWVAADDFPDGWSGGQHHIIERDANIIVFIVGSDNIALSQARETKRIR